MALQPLDRTRSGPQTGGKSQGCVQAWLGPSWHSAAPAQLSLKPGRAAQTQPSCADAHTQFQMELYMCILPGCGKFFPTEPGRSPQKLRTTDLRDCGFHFSSFTGKICKDPSDSRNHPRVFFSTPHSLLGANKHLKQNILKIMKALPLAVMGLEEAQVLTQHIAKSWQFARHAFDCSFECFNLTHLLSLY